MNNLTKQDIINAIQKTAKENGGVPLGKGRFEKETGLKPYDWGKYWVRFGDAQCEAGFAPNKFNSSYDINFVLEKYIVLIKELGHFPVFGDLSVKRHNDPNFPSAKAMCKLGSKKETAVKISEYADRKGYGDVANICRDAIKNIKEKKGSDNFDIEKYVGEVYLFKSGRYYKIGKTIDTVRRGNEIRIQLPEKMDLIHSIKTDDPSGIEAYWHKRFEDKRMQGEWFNLSSSDVKSFKSWKRII